MQGHDEFERSFARKHTRLAAPNAATASRTDQRASSGGHTFNTDKSSAIWRSLTADNLLRPPQRPKALYPFPTADDVETNALATPMLAEEINPAATTHAEAHAAEAAEQSDAPTGGPSAEPAAVQTAPTPEAAGATAEGEATSLEAAASSTPTATNSPKQTKNISRQKPPMSG